MGKGRTAKRISGKSGSRKRVSESSRIRSESKDRTKTSHPRLGNIAYTRSMARGAQLSEVAAEAAAEAAEVKRKEEEKVKAATLVPPTPEVWQEAHS